MKLFEVKEELQDLESYLNSIEPDPETGELVIDKNITERIFALHKRKDEILLYLGSKCKEIEIDIDGFKSVKSGLSARQKTAENRVKWLSEIIKRELPKGDKLEDSQVKLSWRKSESVEILSKVEDFDDIFKKVKIEPDKDEIKKYLKSLKPDPKNLNVILDPRFQLRIKQNLQIK